MTSGTPRPTFRDPAGSLVLEEERAVRRISPSSRDEVLEFIRSPFCKRMQERGDLVGAEIDDSTAVLRLLHPRIPVPTYPWEWTPSQWLAAGELTLDLCDEALDEGWILKDATPLNVLFVGPRPVLVDVLSFERSDPLASIWLAYGQYVRTFLLPLIMHRLMSWPLALSLFKRDGYEPAELYDALGWGKRMSRMAFWPITLPTWLERRKDAEAKSAKPAGQVADPQLALHILKKTIESLRARTQRTVGNAQASNWSGYTGSLTHYTVEQSAAKRAWVQAALAETQPKRVLDVGANTGEFSALAAEMGAEVVALERDGASAERLFLMSREKGLAIQTIHADIARPTPATGWENSETSALGIRLEGQFDVVMMLAVIHHLVLMEQIPLPAILELCHRLTKQHLIVEWVPVEDPMFQSLMRGRDNLYGALSEGDLQRACEGRFETVRRHALGNGRVLFLFEKR